MAMKAGITGAIAGAGSMVFHGEGFNNGVHLWGTTVPAPVAIGAAAATGSVGADLAHTYILPHIPGHEKFLRIESAAVGIGASGLATMGTMQLMHASGEKAMDAFILGAGSYVAGDYISEKFFPSTGTALNLF